MTDINEIIGRAAIAGNISYTETEIGAAVVKALGEAGYSVVRVDDRASLLKRITDWEELLGSIEPMHDQRLVLSKALLRQAAEVLASP